MEATLLGIKEEVIKKEAKKAILLLAKGKIPKDFPKDKALEYLRLKYSQEIGTEFDLIKLKELEEEIINWPRNPDNDPTHFNLLSLAEELSLVLGFTVDFAYEEIGEPQLIKVLNKFLRNNFSIIIVVPLDYLNGPNENTLRILNDFRNKYEVEIYLAWPYKTALQADFIATHVLSFLRSLYR